MRGEGDKVGGYERARDAGFPNSEPEKRAGSRKGEGRKGDGGSKVREGKILDRTKRRTEIKRP